MKQSTLGKLRRHALTTTFAAMLIVAGGIGHALAEDDEDDELPDTKFFRSILGGLGLKKDGVQKDGIDYQERAPLVVPPTRDLPPPQSADPRQSNAAWPQDQDEKRRKEAAAKRRKDARAAGSTFDDLSRQLSPQEMKKGSAKNIDPALSRRSAETPEQYQTPSKPSDLGYVGGLFGSVKDFFGGNNKDESVPFEAEPPRASLTDPPSGYRVPSAAQPYGVGPDRTRSKALTQEDRVTQGVGSTSK